MQYFCKYGRTRSRYALECAASGGAACGLTASADTFADGDWRSAARAQSDKSWTPRPAERVSVSIRRLRRQEGGPHGGATVIKLFLCVSPPMATPADSLY